MEYGWTVKKQSWDKLANYISEFTWQMVPFHETQSQKVPTKNGVYMIVTSPPRRFLKEKLYQQFMTPIYIGSSPKSETEGMRGRFNSHLKREDYSDPIAKAKQIFGVQLKFWYTIIDPDEYKADDPNFIKTIEQLLISTFGPRGNAINAQSTDN